VRPRPPPPPPAADDEALARELDAELNPNGRRTRTRAPLAHNPYQRPRGYGGGGDEEGDWDDEHDEPVSMLLILGAYFWMGR
jgi:hypothetical protein